MKSVDVSLFLLLSCGCSMGKIFPGWSTVLCAFLSPVWIICHTVLKIGVWIYSRGDDFIVGEHICVKPVAEVPVTINNEIPGYGVSVGSLKNILSQFWVLFLVSR